MTGAPDQGEASATSDGDEVEVDLDAVMAQVRAAVEQKRRAGVYSDAFLAALDEPLEIDPDPLFAAGPRWPEVLSTTDIRPWCDLVSTRPIIGPAIVVAKRAVRRALKWYLWPVTDQVTRHNRAVADVLGEQSRQIVRLVMENDRLRRQLTDLRREVKGRSRS